LDKVKDVLVAALNARLLNPKSMVLPFPAFSELVLVAAPVTSNLLVGEELPIPTFTPLLKTLELFTTHWLPFQYGVFPAAVPLVNKPAGP
jgi:hypothetical protein